MTDVEPIASIVLLALAVLGTSTARSQDVDPSRGMSPLPRWLTFRWSSL